MLLIDFYLSVSSFIIRQQIYSITTFLHKLFRICQRVFRNHFSCHLPTARCRSYRWSRWTYRSHYRHHPWTDLRRWYGWSPFQHRLLCRYDQAALRYTCCNEINQRFSIDRLALLSFSWYLQVLEDRVHSTYLSQPSKQLHENRQILHR